MALSTTGTVTTTSWDTRTVIDRAYGALGLTPQQIVGEKITIAQDLLGICLADQVNIANPLWCLDKTLITLTQGQREYVMPNGTNDVNRAFFRTMSNVTPAAFTNTATAFTIDSGLTNSAGSGTIWYDMSNSNARRYWRVIPTVTVPVTILSVTAARVYNTPNDIMMYRMNKDDYWNMTNKFFQGRPLQFWLDRQLTPVMALWPQPDLL